MKPAVRLFSALSICLSAFGADPLNCDCGRGKRPARRTGRFPNPSSSAVAIASQRMSATQPLRCIYPTAGKPAEIHIYYQVNAGFAMSKRGMPVDTWPEPLLDWMQLHKLLNP